MILSMQIVGLFFGIWTASSNAGNVFQGKSVSAADLAFMSAMWTLFITATWLI